MLPYHVALLERNEAYNYDGRVDNNRVFDTWKCLGSTSKTT